MMGFGLLPRADLPNPAGIGIQRDTASKSTTPGLDRVDTGGQVRPFVELALPRPRNVLLECSTLVELFGDQAIPLALVAFERVPRSYAPFLPKLPRMLRAPCRRIHQKDIALSLTAVIRRAT